MEALNDLVRSGKVRYIGASSMNAWQFQKANAIANKNGWAKFVSMQNMYNLIHREEEREMIPYCYDSCIASIHWSPLAKGLLIGKNRDTVRKNTDIIAPQLFGDKLNANDDAIID
jgi:aryl-alcohol dehydrogenase-like predicted oxidoreductase